MDKINFQNGVTKVNADTFNTFQNNIEKSAVIVSKNEPTTNEKVWFRKGKNLLNKDTLINAALNEVNGTLEQNNTRLASELLFLKAGTYTISCNLSRFAYVKYNLDKTFNSFISWNTLPNQIVLNSDCYIRIEFIGDENGSINISKSDIKILQLEGGSNLTTYEAYIEPKIYIKNDNGVYEEFIKKDENAYSTDERKVGTWIDGKPIYRKVIITTSPTSINDFQSIAILPENEKTLVNLRAQIYVQNASIITQVPFSFATESLGSIYFDPKTKNIIMSTNNSTYINSEVTIIAEYTKTTD